MDSPATIIGVVLVTVGGLVKALQIVLSHRAGGKDGQHLERIINLEKEVKGLRDWRHEIAGDHERLDAMWKEFCGRHGIK